MQIEEYNMEVLNLQEFIQVYNIEMILNNRVVQLLNFDLENFEKQLQIETEEVIANIRDYFTAEELQDLGPEAVEEAIESIAFTNVQCQEVYQYYIVSDRDADYFMKYTSYPVYYSNTADMYLIGITHYGMSWSFFFTTAERPAHMRVKKYDEILTGAGSEI